MAQRRRKIVNKTSAATLDLGRYRLFSRLARVFGGVPLLINNFGASVCIPSVVRRHVPSPLLRAKQRVAPFVRPTPPPARRRRRGDAAAWPGDAGAGAGHGAGESAHVARPGEVPLSLAGPTGIVPASRVWRDRPRHRPGDADRRLGARDPAVQWHAALGAAPVEGHDQRAPMAPGRREYDRALPLHRRHPLRRSVGALVPEPRRDSPRAPAALSIPTLRPAAPVLLMLLVLLMLPPSHLRPTPSVSRLTPAGNEQIFATLLSISHGWGHLLGLTTFVVTFFVGHALSYWRNCYKIARQARRRAGAEVGSP